MARTVYHQNEAWCGRVQVQVSYGRGPQWSISTRDNREWEGKKKEWETKERAYGPTGNIEI